MVTKPEMRSLSGYSLYFLAILSPLIIVIATLTFFYFSSFPEMQYAIFRIAPGTFLLLLVSAPFCLGPPFLRPNFATVAAAKVHAALYTAFVLISAMTSQPGHSSPGDAIGSLIEFFFVVTLIFELITLAAIVTRVRNRQADLIVTPWIFTGLVAALVGGWGLGVLAWAVQIPPKVIAAAEDIAQGRPYCIDVDGRPASGIRNLTGVTMLARRDFGWAWNFHALLVVERGPNRAYFNWSYKKGGFQPVSDQARIGLQLGTSNPIRCKPVEHFARDWL